MGFVILFGYFPGFPVWEIFDIRFNVPRDFWTEAGEAGDTLADKRMEYQNPVSRRRKYLTDYKYKLWSESCL